jgi:ATP-dependent Lon protease
MPRAMEPREPSPGNLLLPVVPLRDMCLFPEASLTVLTGSAPALKALEIAQRSGGRLLAVCVKDEAARETQPVGTIAQVSEDLVLSEGGHRVELDGQGRARVVTLVATEVWLAEAEPLPEGDPGDEWGSAVEALARYLHAHADLRSFLDQQRRSKEPMSWVNLACQHLPITATARQKLLDADAPERCLKISRGLDALLRKEQGS